MSPAQLLALVAAVGGALLLSELLLGILGLRRAHIGGLLWFAGCLATAWGARWAVAHTTFAPEHVHYAALALAAVLTALWLNDRSPRRTKRPAAGPAATRPQL